MEINLRPMREEPETEGFRSGGAKHAQPAASYSAVAVDGGLDRVRLSLVQVLRKVCVPTPKTTVRWYLILRRDLP